MSRFVLLALAVALIGCGDRRTLRPDEAEILAWWIEDVAHGLPRRPEELRLVDSSERLSHIADWANGDEIRGERQPPRLLLARRNRQSLLATFLAHGSAVITPEGLLAPRPGLELTESEVVTPVIDAENRDRRQLEGIVLALADAEARESVSQELIADVRKARIALDERAGGKVWSGSATPAKR